MILEGAQAGLSWLTILKKRRNYQEAFHNFDAKKVARFTKRDLKRLLANPGIVRNRLKILATIDNAHKFLDIRSEFGSFDSYIWQFTEGKPIQHKHRSLKQIPAKTIESDRMSKDLQDHGFRFVGSVICYSFMQAVGMVNDHTTSCFRYREVQGR